MDRARLPPGRGNRARLATKALNKKRERCLVAKPQLGRTAGRAQDTSRSLQKQSVTGAVRDAALIEEKDRLRRASA